MIEQFWLFHCGYMTVPRGLILRGGGMEMARLPFLAAVAIHSELGPILIDAPFGHEGPENAGDVIGAMLRTTGLEFRPEWAVAPRLEQLGYRPAEIEHVLMTHLHWDHTGGMKGVGHAKIHINRPEWDGALALSNFEAARAGYALGDFRALGNRVELFEIDASHDDLDGIDLFGDGSVRAVSLPGHSYGHVGYRFKLADRELFFVGDATFSIGQVTRGEGLGIFPRLVASNLEAARATIERLKLFHDEHDDVTLVSSHDFDWGEAAMAGPQPLH